VTDLYLVAQLVRAVILAVAALFPIVNPLGSAPIFLSLTREYPAEIRQNLVRRITLNSFILLAVSTLIGSHVLHFFGISIPVVQVAGGLIVSATGWSLLTQKDADSKPHKIDPVAATQKAFYPLTLPLTVGPGSISVAITLGADAGRSIYVWPVVLATAIIGPLIVALSVYISYRSAARFERILGETGIGVFLRLSAFIVICIGVQIMWNGVAALIHGL
jgi:multiple antibiotic resistance protein